LIVACPGSPCAAINTAVSHTIAALETAAHMTRDTWVRRCPMADIVEYRAR
jgi:hypothetical protein